MELRGRGPAWVDVGEANQLRGVFSTAMEELDGDDVRVSSRGRYAERDIVQVDSPGRGSHGAERHGGKERPSWQPLYLTAFLISYLSPPHSFSLPAFLEQNLGEKKAGCCSHCGFIV